MKGNPGIYYIYNKISDKYYIGSSSRSTIKRINDHRTLLIKNKHLNNKLQRSWNKHRENNFIFQTLEECEANLCIGKEQEWMDLLQSYEDDKGYNIAPVAGSSLGQKRTPEQIENIRKSVIGLSKGCKNGRYGKSWSEDQRVHFRKVMPQCKPVYQIDITTNSIIADFDSIKHAAKVLHIDPAPISKVCRQKPKHKTAYGYLWKFKEVV